MERNQSFFCRCGGSVSLFRHFNVSSFILKEEENSWIEKPRKLSMFEKTSRCYLKKNV